MVGYEIRLVACLLYCTTSVNAFPQTAARGRIIEARCKEKRSNPNSYDLGFSRSSGPKLSGSNCSMVRTSDLLWSSWPCFQLLKTM